MTNDIDVIRSFFDVMQTEGFEAAIAKFGAKDFTWWAAGLGEIQDKVGRIGQIMAENLDQDGLRLDRNTFTGSDNRVAVEAECFATLKDGKNYNNKYVFIFYLEDSKIRVMKEYNDTAHAHAVWGQLFDNL